MTSQDELQKIRESIQNIEEELVVSRQMRDHDPVTGTLGAMGLDHVLLKEVRRARSGDGKLTAVMVHIEGLDDARSAHGNELIDLLLNHFSNIAKAVLRDADTLARYGTEQFLILLPETEMSGTRYVIERLRTVAGNTPFIHKSKRIEIIFTAGGSTLKMDENGRSMVLRAADALGKARHAGRGGIELTD